MDDLISRQAAIDEVHGAIYEFFDICDDDEESPITYKDEQLLELNKAITIRIKQLQSARPKGKWIELNNHDWEYSKEYRCSECGKYRLETLPKGWNWNFCPNCGADMREVE